MKKFFLLSLFFISIFNVAHAQQMKTEVIPLGYRSANEVIPVLRPLVAPSGSISGLQGQLVVTATPQQLAQLRKVLAQLDKSPIRLMISVRRGNSFSAKQGSASIQGRVGNISVNDGGVRVGSHPSDNDTLSARAKVNDRDEDMNITQRVQVLEGREAYIYAGEEIPVRNRGAVVGPGGVVQYDSTEFYPAVTGFYATPRINGDQVILEINSSSRMRNNIRTSNRYSGNRNPGNRNSGRGVQSASVSNVRTSVSGRLGEWINIGGVDQSAVNRASGIASVVKGQQESSSQIYVRVEKIEGGN